MDNLIYAPKNTLSLAADPFSSALNQDAVHSKYLYANLHIGDPGFPCRQNVLGNWAFEMDFNEMSNGNLELWDDATNPTDFTALNIAREDGEVHGGTYSAKFTGIASQLTQIIWVPAGEAFTIEIWGFGDGADPLTYYLINPYTNKQMNAAGAWVASAAFGSQTAAAWAKTTISSTVESYSTCGNKHLVPLRLWVYNNGSGAAYTDDLALWPHTNFFSIHGHNLQKPDALVIESDDNAAFASGVERLSTTGPLLPSYYKKFSSMLVERYWAVSLTNNSAMDKFEVGEMWFGQYHTLTKLFRNDDHLRPVRMPQAQSRNLAGRPYRRNLSNYPTGGVVMSFAGDATDHGELLEMHHRCDYGERPMVVVPKDSEALSYMGFLPATIPVRRGKPLNRYESDNIFFETMPFAVPFA